MSNDTDTPEAAAGEPKAIAPDTVPETVNAAVSEPATDGARADAVEAAAAPEAPVEAPVDAHVQDLVEPEEASRAVFADAAHSEPLIEPAPQADAEAAPEAAAEAVPEAPAVAEPAPEAAAIAAAGASAHEPEPDEGGHDGDEPGTGDKVKDEAFEIAKTIVYALLIALVLRVFLFQPFTIPSASMEPNLYEGDYIIVSKWDYGYSKHSIPFSPPFFKGRILQMGKGPQRGDIVVFKLPRDNKTDYIKRLIGLPGDQVQMLDNQLYINGKAVPNTHVGKPGIIPTEEAYNDIQEFRETLPGGKTHAMQDFGPNHRLDTTGVFTVPEGYYFMMGDNRDNSLDSRVSKEDGGVDFVPAENLVGHARVVLFSWHEGASLWKPWTWFTKLRLSRFFHGLQ